MVYLKLLAGFILLIYSGKYLVKGSVAVANALNMSKVLIGLTIVSIGTSAPELLVSISAALKGYPDVAVYNVLGSNISNIAVVLAITVMVFPVLARPETIRVDWPLMAGFSFLMFVFLLDLQLTRYEGLFLVILMAGAVMIFFFSSRKLKQDAGAVEENAGMKLWVAILVIVLSAAGLAFGANLLVENTVNIARDFNISERVISVTMIAVGTSIPEMTTSVIAALKKESEISLGNIIGSNIFNIGFVLGMTALISPIAVNPLAVKFDLYVMLGFALLLLVLLLIPERLILSRWKGLLMLIAYLGYLYLILERIT